MVICKDNKVMHADGTTRNDGLMADIDLLLLVAVRSFQGLHKRRGIEVAGLVSGSRAVYREMICEYLYDYGATVVCAAAHKAR